MDAYVYYKFYLRDYRLGSAPVIPKLDFPFYEQQARTNINGYILQMPEKIPDEVKFLTCELADYLYMNEGSENKTAESQTGRNVTYDKGTVYSIITRHLLNTGLLYRGADGVNKRRS